MYGPSGKNVEGVTDEYIMPDAEGSLWNKIHDSSMNCSMWAVMAKCWVALLKDL